MTFTKKHRLHTHIHRVHIQPHIHNHKYIHISIHIHKFNITSHSQTYSSKIKTDIVRRIVFDMNIDSSKLNTFDELSLISIAWMVRVIATSFGWTMRVEKVVHPRM